MVLVTSEIVSPLILTLTSVYLKSIDFALVLRSNKEHHISWTIPRPAQSSMVFLLFITSQK